MPDIHIHREHTLGLSTARQVAQHWAEKAEAKLDMNCRYETGAQEDTLHFSRSGVEGQLRVGAQTFDLQADLGFLFKAFQGQVEQQVAQQLDELIERATSSARPDPAGA